MAYRIRDVIVERMAQQEHSIAAAEAAMGMPKATLHRFLNEETVELGKCNCDRVAAYVGISEAEAIKMVRRDGAWIRRRRAREGFIPVQIVEVAEDLLTWWGTVPARPRVGRSRYQGCKNCEFKPACRQAVDTGRPLPCEQFLVREVLAPHERASRGAHVGASVR